MSITLPDSIRYIGVDDTEIDLFESQYIVPNGISYNSYLILDEKTAILDTVDARKSAEWLDKLDHALAGRIPDLLILHHLEPDHSGTIGKIVARYPNIQLVASAAAFRMLPQFFGNIDLTNRTIVVKDGDTLPLGTHTLRFFTAAMVHWPEVVVSYEEREKILFSADAFGKFGALSHDEEWDCEARRYYFNICGKYGVQVQSLLKKVAPLEIARICPLHGPILDKNLAHHIGLYDTWSSYAPETDGVFVAYASIHGGTAEAALQLAEMLREQGVPKVSVSDLCRDDMAEAIEDAFRMSRMVVAAASYDGGLFPPMYNFLHHLQIKNYQKRRVGIIENGSWAPCAGRIMNEMLAAMKGVEIVQPQVTIRSRMQPADYSQLEALAKAIG